jgi:hypothetical protein
VSRVRKLLCERWDGQREKYTGCHITIARLVKVRAVTA